MFNIDAFNDSTSESERFGEFYIVELERIGFTYDQDANVCYYMFLPMSDTSPMMTYCESDVLVVMTKSGTLKIMNPSMDLMMDLMEKLITA